MNYDEARELLKDFVSESDINLFDLLSIHVDGIKKTLEIFGDRNPIDSTTSLAMSVIQTLICILFSKKVTIEKLNQLIEDGEDFND